ncbi:MAG TPA: transposase [Myxococcaceae bacterium]|nr:transposase [Myxococcaceae bacterium]
MLSAVSYLQLSLPWFRGHLRRGVHVHDGERTRRKFSPEFKAETVKLVRETGKPVGQVAQELDLTETALRYWVGKPKSTRGKARRRR